MNEQENTVIVQQAYQNFKTGNIGGLLDLCAEDITWELPELEIMPIAGKRTGRDSVQEFFAMLARDQDVLEFEPREFVAQRDKVVSLGHYRWRVKDTDREYRSDFVHIFTVNGGKITSFREHFDTAVVTVAYQRALSA